MSNRLEELVWRVESALSTAFEAVEELDALVRRELGGDPSPIGEVQSGFARQALSAIREAGERLRPASRSASAEEWTWRSSAIGYLLLTASRAVELLDEQLRRLRGENPERKTDSGRRALEALRRAHRELDLLGALVVEGQAGGVA